jgi:hypothetical protein
MASRAFESVAGGALTAPVLAETAHGLFSGLTRSIVVLMFSGAGH